MTTFKGPGGTDHRPENSKEIDRSIGEQISKARMSRRLTIETVASHLGLRSVDLEQIESGEQRATAEMLMDLARLYKVPISHFYKTVNNTLS
jgi:transcriptional regulator with XRE-family HTH domain